MLTCTRVHMKLSPFGAYIEYAMSSDTCGEQEVVKRLSGGVLVGWYIVTNQLPVIPTYSSYLLSTTRVPTLHTHHGVCEIMTTVYTYIQCTVQERFKTRRTEKGRAHSLTH